MYYGDKDISVDGYGEADCFMRDLILTIDIKTGTIVLSKECWGGAEDCSYHKSDLIWTIERKTGPIVLSKESLG